MAFGFRMDHGIYIKKTLQPLKSNVLFHDRDIDPVPVYRIFYVSCMGQMEYPVSRHNFGIYNPDTLQCEYGGKLRAFNDRQTLYGALAHIYVLKYPGRHRSLDRTSYLP